MPRRWPGASDTVAVAWWALQGCTKKNKATNHRVKRFCWTPHPGMHWKPPPPPPLEGAQPIPSRCFPGSNGQLQWYL